MKLKNTQVNRIFNESRAAHILTYTSEHKEDIDNIVKALEEYEGLKIRLEMEQNKRVKAGTMALEFQKENNRLKENQIEQHKIFNNFCNEIREIKEEYSRVNIKFLETSTLLDNLKKENEKLIKYNQELAHEISRQKSQVENSRKELRKCIALWHETKEENEKLKEDNNLLNEKLKAVVNIDSLITRLDELIGTESLKQQLDKASKLIFDTIEYLTTLKDIPNDNAEEKLINRLREFYQEVKEDPNEKI